MFIQESGLWWTVKPFQGCGAFSHYKPMYFTWEVWFGPELLEWGYTETKEQSVLQAGKKYLALRDGREFGYQYAV